MRAFNLKDSFIYLGYLSAIILISFILSVYRQSHYLIKKLREHESLVEKDIARISSNYLSTLVKLREALKDKSLNPEVLNKDNVILESLLDQSLYTNGLILVDKDLLFVQALKFKGRKQTLDFSNRKYLQDLRVQPTKPVIGGITIGNISKTLSVPLAVAILDKENKFKGALILSVPLTSLSNYLKYLSDNLLVNISVGVQETADYDTRYIANDLYSIYTKILLIPRTNIIFSFSSSTLRQQVNFYYNLYLLRSYFLKTFLAYFAIGILVTAIFTFLNNTLFKPLVQISNQIRFIYSIINNNVENDVIHRLIVENNFLNNKILLDAIAKRIIFDKEFIDKNKKLQYLSMAHILYLYERREDLLAEHRDSLKILEAINNLYDKHKDIFIECNDLFINLGEYISQPKELINLKSFICDVSNNKILIEGLENILVACYTEPFIKVINLILEASRSQSGSLKLQVYYEGESLFLTFYPLPSINIDKLSVITHLYMLVNDGTVRIDQEDSNPQELTLVFAG